MTRKFFLLLLIGTLSFPAFAQFMNTKSNILFGPMIKSIRTSQEVRVGPRTTTQTTAKVKPGAVFNLQWVGSVYIFDEQQKAWSFPRMGGGGNVTEMRIYGKEKGAMKGFYFGPYASYSFANLKSGDIPVQFNAGGQMRTATLTQELRAYVAGGGFQIGTQSLKKKFVVDWTILGIGLGKLGIKGTIDATNTSAGFDFREYMENPDNIKFGIEKIFSIKKKVVEANRISFDRSILWPTFRMGVSMGFAYGKVPQLGKNKDKGGDSGSKYGDPYKKDDGTSTPDPKKEAEKKAGGEAEDMKKEAERLEKQAEEMRKAAEQKEKESGKEGEPKKEAPKKEEASNSGSRNKSEKQVPCGSCGGCFGFGSWF